MTDHPDIRYFNLPIRDFGLPTHGSHAGHPGPDQAAAGPGQQHLSALLWRDRTHRHRGGLLLGGTGNDRQAGPGADQFLAQGFWQDVYAQPGNEIAGGICTELEETRAALIVLDFGFSFTARLEMV